MITGATGQLGTEICKMFADNKANVIVSDLEIDKCQRLVGELENKHDSGFLSLELDVTSEDSCKFSFRYNQ